MEKIMVPLWKRNDLSDKDFRRQLLEDFSATLLADDSTHSMKMCIVDEHVQPAEAYRMVSLMSPPFDAMIIAWLDAGDDILAYRAGIEKLCSSFHAYIVTESDRLPRDLSGLPSGHRTDGMNEIVALQKPEWLERDKWIHIWHESHTQIAIDTQSTYGYRQNIVARALTADAPVIDAFIEENFPEKAIHSRLGFYDVATEEEQRERETIMIESCARFIDFEKIDCIPTSEYIMK